MNRRNFKMRDNDEELRAHESMERRACQIYLVHGCVFAFQLCAVRIARERPRTNCPGFFSKRSFLDS
jgi:hypothetical protein